MSLAYRQSRKKPWVFGDERPHPVVRCTVEEDRTKQSELGATDINRIVHQYVQMGMPRNENARFIDVTELPDYRTALHQVQVAESVFMTLSAVDRLRFDNDPAVFLDFMADPANRDELVKLKLVPPGEGPAKPGEDVSTPGVPAAAPKAPDVVGVAGEKPKAGTAPA